MVVAALAAGARTSDGSAAESRLIHCHDAATLYHGTHGGTAGSWPRPPEQPAVKTLLRMSGVDAVTVDSIEAVVAAEFTAVGIRSVVAVCWRHVYSARNIEICMFDRLRGS